MNKNYRQIEFLDGDSIEAAIKELNSHKDRVYGSFNGVMLYSDIDDVNSANKKLKGKSKINAVKINTMAVGYLPQSELQRFFKEKPSVSVKKLAEESDFNSWTLYALLNAKCKYTDSQAELLVEKVVPVMNKYGFVAELTK